MQFIVKLTKTTAELEDYFQRKQSNTQHQSLYPTPNIVQGEQIRNKDELLQK